MRIVGRIDEHVAAGVDDGVIIDARGRNVVNAQNIDRAADADDACRDAEADHHDVLCGACVHRDVAGRVNRGALADIGVVVLLTTLTPTAGATPTAPPASVPATAR